MSAHEEMQKKFWVVFTGKTDIWWLKFLKKEFRHCFLIINDGARWISVDPLSAYTDIQIYDHIDSQFDLPRWLKSAGYKALETSAKHNHVKPAPAMFFTCVEAIKRMLGIHHRNIFTPYQLYQFLKKNEKNLKGE